MTIRSSTSKVEDNCWGNLLSCWVNVPSVSVSEYIQCQSLVFDLTIAPDSVATHNAFTTTSGSDLPPESANTVSTVASPTTAPPPAATGATAASSKVTAYAATTSATAFANTWHKRLGHPNVQVLERLARIDGSGVKLRDSFSACDTCKINKSSQQNHANTANTDGITERLQLVSTGLLGPISTIGGFNYMAKFTDHLTRMKAVYFIASKSDALSSLVNYVQDVAILLGLRVSRLHSENGGEYTSSDFAGTARPPALSNSSPRRTHRSKTASPNETAAP